MLLFVILRAVLLLGFWYVFFQRPSTYTLTGFYIKISYSARAVSSSPANVGNSFVDDSTLPKTKSSGKCKHQKNKIPELLDMLNAVNINLQKLYEFRGEGEGNSIACLQIPETPKDGICAFLLDRDPNMPGISLSDVITQLEILKDKVKDACGSIKANSDPATTGTLVVEYIENKPCDGFCSMNADVIDPPAHELESWDDHENCTNQSNAIERMIQSLATVDQTVSYSRDHYYWRIGCVHAEDSSDGVCALYTKNAEDDDFSVHDALV